MMQYDLVARPLGISETLGTSSLDPRWKPLAERDTNADGTFVYGVTSTGIYCRPGCPSRRPRADRVRFFETTTEARQSGFRACKRCRPDAVGLAQPGVEAVRRASAYLSTHADQPVTLAHLARVTAMSPHHLQRRFKAIVGLSPSNYRRGGAGMSIGYSTVSSALGQVLVAATVDGVCSVKLGDSETTLVRDLRREYPSAEIRANKQTRTEWVKAILQHLRGAEPSLDLPIDVQATAFQWTVWRALQRIPYGETRAYAEVATAIGQPKAARAVARACATNPVCLVVPCHRVVPAAGGTGGYRWGADRKKRLLAVEEKRR